MSKVATSAGSSIPVSVHHHGNDDPRFAPRLAPQAQQPTIIYPRYNGLRSGFRASAKLQGQK